MPVFRINQGGYSKWWTQLTSRLMCYQSHRYQAQRWRGVQSFIDKVLWTIKHSCRRIQIKCSLIFLLLFVCSLNRFLCRKIITRRTSLGFVSVIHILLLILIKSQHQIDLWHDSKRYIAILSSFHLFKSVWLVKLFIILFYRKYTFDSNMYIQMHSHCVLIVLNLARWLFEPFI